MPARRLPALLPVLLVALATILTLPAEATVKPPVVIRMDPDAAVAEAGKVYEGVFEVRLDEPGLLQKWKILSDGWDVIELDLPEDGFYSQPTTLLIPFKARPSDPEVRIGLSVDYECQTARKTFALGPEARAKRGRPIPLQSYPRTPSIHVPDLAPTEENQRGGAITLRVVGRIVYDRIGKDVDDDGNPLQNPIPPLTLGVEALHWRLIDVDPIGDETIAEGETGVYGHFDSGDVLWDDCDVTGCDDPDLKLEFFADTPVAFASSDGSYLGAYYWTTTEMEDFTGNYHDYGELKAPDPLYQPILHIWNTIIRTNRFLGNYGYAMPKVTILWPELDAGNAGAFYTSGDQTIHIAPEKQWREGTQAHEYGHHFLSTWSTTIPTAYCNDYCDGEDSCTAGIDCEDAGHCGGCPETDHDAWNEGFPDWMASAQNRWMEVAIVNDDNSPHRNLYPYSFESAATCCQDDVFYEAEAYDVESFVAALLRDIEDSNFDLHSWNPDPNFVIRDSLCLGADEIFDLVTTVHPTTMLSFLNFFLIAHPEHAANLKLTTYNTTPTGWTLPNWPVDTQPMGPVLTLDSTTHPYGEGGNLPCMTAVWDLPVDDSNGACGYSVAWSSTPAVTVDDTEDSVFSVGCQLARTGGVNWIGDVYVGIRAKECGGTMGGTSTFGPFEMKDCNANGVVDLCDISCNHTGDANLGCTVGAGFCNVPGCDGSDDCNGNLVPDECDIASGTSADCNENGIPDECETTTLKNWKGGSGLWADAAGWVEGSPPVNGNDACIQDAQAQATVTYGSGTVTVPVLASTENLQLAGGGLTTKLILSEPSWNDGDVILKNNNTILEVQDRLDIGGSLVWTGSNNTSSAKLTGAGTTYVAGGLSVPSGIVHLDGHDLVLLEGSSSVVSGRIDTLNPTSLTIRPTATLDFLGTQHLINGNNTALIVEGTLTKSAGTTATTINAPIQNDGLIHVQSGELQFWTGSTMTGDVVGDPGTVVNFNCGTHDLLANSSVVADQVVFSGGNCGARHIRGTYDVTTKTTQQSSSAVTFHAGANVVGYGTDLILQGGSTTFDAATGSTLFFDNVVAGSVVYFNSGDSIVAQNFSLNGSVYGASPITVNGTLTWPAGRHFWAGGPLVSNGTLNLTAGGSSRTLDRSLTINGPSTFQGTLQLNNGASVHVTPTGSIDVTFDGTMLTSITPPYTNEGTLRKIGGTGTSLITTGSTSTGTIEVQTGTLAFWNLTQSAGQLVLDGGDFAMTSANPLQMTGGALRGTGTVSGGVNNSGGSVEPGLSAGTITMPNNYTQGAGGRLLIELGGPTPGTEYDQLVLTGSATASLNGTLRVELIDGYVPPAGATFDVLVAPNVVGDFATIETAGLPAGLAVRIVDRTNGVTLQVYDPSCSGPIAGGPAACPAALCPTIAYMLGNDPELSFADPANCPAGAALPGPIDFIQGFRSQLRIDAGTLELGTVTAGDCGEVLDAFYWDDGAPPAPGDVYFFLARPQGAGGYGQASSGEPRIPQAGDCP